MNLFRRMIRTDGSAIPIVALLLMLLYGLLCLITDNQVLMLGLHVTRILIAVAVIITYYPHWYSAFHAERLGKVDQLALGVFVTWMAVFFHACYSLAWRALGNPDWMVQSDMMGIPYFIAMMGGTLHITAMRTEKGTVPMANVTMVMVAFITGILAGMAGAYYGEILQNLENLAH